jgi:hypothetical protein
LQEGSEESSSDCGGLRKVESGNQNLAVLAGMFIKKFGSFPTFPPLAKLCEKNVIEGVSRFINDEVSNNGHTQKVKVADEVKYFVADKLVSVTKAVRVENPKII